VRCLNASTDVHHLISPRVDPSLFMSPLNVCALCKDCHPAGVAGTPDWCEGKDYVATSFEITL
jgi:hypothetical protein